MSFFIDSNGKKWCVEIDLRTMRNIKRNHGVDLMDFQSFSARSADDPLIVADIVQSIVCQSSDEQDEFNSGFSGDTLEAATEALVDAIIDFFPRRRRELFRAAVEKVRDVADVADRLAMKAMDQLDTKTIMDALDGILPSDAPESSE